MEIDYKCQRCDKTVRAKVTKKESHTRLDCTECRKYIKFIGESELNSLKIFSDSKEGGNDRLDEINFKLDLILDHLGIKNG